VIPFPSSVWSFYDYGNEIEDWYRSLSENGREILESMLKTNSKAPVPAHWIGSKMLQGRYKQDGIWEWYFMDDRCQQRLMGIFGEDRKTAIFLIGCSHKQRVYTPPDCLDTAAKRAREVRNGTARLRRREVREDF
jgi:hypothetical protein